VVFTGFYRILSELVMRKLLKNMQSFTGDFTGPYIYISPIKLKDSSKVERVNSLSTVAVEKALKNES
jgi:hypothetical protein